MQAPWEARGGSSASGSGAGDGFGKPCAGVEWLRSHCAWRERRPRRLSPTALAAAARPPGQFLERVLIKDGANVHVIPVERIDRIEAQDDYVAIHTEGKSHLKPQTPRQLESALDPARFIRGTARIS